MMMVWFPEFIFLPRHLRKPGNPVTLIPRVGAMTRPEVLRMKKKFQRLAAQKTAPRKIKNSPMRRLIIKAAPTEAMTVDEVSHLETLVKRFEESEKAWQRMTAPIDDADPWTQVEEHMLERRDGDADRRWKFFAK